MPCPPVSAFRLFATAAAAVALGLLVLASAPVVAGHDLAPQLPQRLADTGLYEDGSLSRVRADKLPFVPQYPLWTDGAAKRRWIYLPPGTHIDASDPDVWQFPAGTRLWKEFEFAGRPVETRFIERLPDGQWRFATYLWNLQGSDALLAPERGVRSLPAPGAPGDLVAIPSRADCRICHEGGPSPVLGFGALQLSSDRDPGAAHAESPGAPAQTQAMDLVQLQARGLVRHLPQTLQRQPPRIAAADATTRAALGYLHANCSHCHNDTGPLASLDMGLQQSVADPAASAARTLQSLLGKTSHYQSAGSERQTDQYARRVDTTDADASMLLQRMRSSLAARRMPPLGVSVPDQAGIALIRQWISETPAFYHPKEKRP